MDTTSTKPAAPMFGLNDTQQMMYAFGDARRPNIETAKLSKITIIYNLNLTSFRY